MKKSKNSKDIFIKIGNIFNNLDTPRIDRYIYIDGITYYIDKKGDVVIPQEK